MKHQATFLPSLFGLFLILPVSAQAHTGIASGNSLLSGLQHPLSGIDHLLVMLGIGIWAAYRHGRAKITMPLCFVAAMLVGAALNYAGYALYGAESLVAASVLLTGMLLCKQNAADNKLHYLLIALFALPHGFVHAQESAASAAIAEYSAGFALMTACLLTVGVFLGRYLNKTGLLLKSFAISSIVSGMVLLAAA